MSYKITFITQAINLAKFVLKGDFERVSAEVYTERLSTCMACKFYEPKGNLGLGKCKKCGCTKFKLEFKNQKCKLKKWKE